MAGKACSTLAIGSVEAVGERMLADRRIAADQRDGLHAMGKRVAEVAAKRLGRTLLELGGNNGVIVMAGRRPEHGGPRRAFRRRRNCRPALHEYPPAFRSTAHCMPKLTERLVAAYEQVRIGRRSIR